MFAVMILYDILCKSCTLQIPPVNHVSQSCVTQMPPFKIRVIQTLPGKTI